MHTHREAGEVDRPARVPGRVPVEPRPVTAEAVAALQRSAGNGVVTRLLTGPPSARRPSPRPAPVQRCGPVPCDCGPEQREAAEAGPAVARSVLPPGAPVQRVAADFAIRGKFRRAAAHPGTVFFDLGEITPDAAERAKLTALAVPAARPLTLRGTASEEGRAGVNTALVDQRIDAVSTVLAANGHAGPRTPEPLPAAGAGNIDYRRARSVEVRPTGGASTAPDCSAGSAPNDCGPMPNPFSTGLTRAHAMIAAARGALSGPPDAATSALLTQLFGGVGAAGAVDANLALIDAQLTHMVPFAPTSGHRCVNSCDPSCGGGATAYNTGTGAAAQMTLCPVFLTDPSLDRRAGVLFHEATHATPGLETGDQSYVWQRLITQLPAALALQNADSYTAFVRLIASPGSITLGPAVPDTHAGMSPAEQAQVDRAVAWVQQWVVGTSSELSATYGVAQESIAAGSWTNGYYKDAMAFIAPAFGLRSPPALPTRTDCIGLAGIHDRYEELVRAVSRPLALAKAPGPRATWSPGPGTAASFGASFFALSPRNQVVALLRALIAALPTISSAKRASYLAVVNAVETHQGLGSP
jgi:hypothetical protein